MQAGVPVRVHKAKDKSARWPRAWPASVQLSDDCCAGDLVEVLESLQAWQLLPDPASIDLVSLTRTIHHWASWARLRHLNRPE